MKTNKRTKTVIDAWIEDNGFELSETRSEFERGYSHPSGAFLLKNTGDGEPAFWALYYPPGDGEQADETGSFDDIPDWSSD